MDLEVQKEKECMDRVAKKELLWTLEGRRGEVADVVVGDGGEKGRGKYISLTEESWICDSLSTLTKSG